MMFNSKPYSNLQGLVHASKAIAIEKEWCKCSVVLAGPLAFGLQWSKAVLASGTMKFVRPCIVSDFV